MFLFSESSGTSSFQFSPPPNLCGHTSALIPDPGPLVRGSWVFGVSWKGPLKEAPDTCPFPCLSSPCCLSLGLQYEVDRLNSEIQKASQEVTFLSTYMDHEYPIRLVQIANHERQVQQAKDSQQEELDSLKEMRENILAFFSKTIQEKKMRILKALVVDIQKPHENILLLKTLHSRRLQKCMFWFRELIEQLKEEIPILLSEVEQMYAEIWNPREAVFKDVLLQRPKCTPDMAVELNIPVQDPFSLLDDSVASSPPSSPPSTRGFSC